MRPVLLAALLAATPALAAPSFDCAKARAPAEKAICASPEASNLDARLAGAYRAALARLADDALAVKSLKTDQQVFIHYRDEFIGNQNFQLVPYLAHRIAFLEAIDAAPREGVHGRWRSVWGETTLARTASGAAEVTQLMVQPAIQRWTCGDPKEAVAARQEQDAVVTGDAVAGRRFSRKGRLLLMEVTGTDPSTGCDHLGIQPRLMFPVAAPGVTPRPVAQAAAPATPAVPAATMPRPKRTVLDYLRLINTDSNGNDHRFFVNAAEYAAPPLAERRLLAEGKPGTTWSITEQSDERLVFAHKSAPITIELQVRMLDAEYLRTTHLNPNDSNSKRRRVQYYFRLLEDGRTLDIQFPQAVALAADTMTPQLPFSAIPRDIHLLVRKIYICDHYANEEPDAAAQERENKRVIKPGDCKTLPAQEAKLRATHAGNPTLTTLIDRALARVREQTRLP